MTIPNVTVMRGATNLPLVEQFLVELSDPTYRALRRRAAALGRTPEQFLAWLLVNQLETCL